MKTERRHELQKNELADWLGEKLNQVQKYSGAIGASVLAVVVLIAVGLYISNRSANQAAVAWEEYFRASGAENPDQLKELAERLAGSTPGKFARLRLADQQLQSGTNQLFQDRAEARKSLAGAVENYRWVAEHAGDKLLEERATLGLAKSYESEDKLQEAREQYKKLLDRSPEGVYAREARDRLRDLDKQSTRQFYDWFAEQQTKPPGSLEPGIPGLKPKFDTSSLPTDEPDIKFQHAPATGGNQPPGQQQPAGKQPPPLAFPDRTPDAKAPASAETPPSPPEKPKSATEPPK
ncbi:MAG TPA: hypothetical protein VHV55_20180 [Pirellulales bacterium]|jgi:hypothetical protein|nr:hypothetical protein [Pirellulales bacterium]